jgi:hypothetical protein
MYSREILSKYIDIALRSDAASGMVAELIGELEQIPISLQTDENGELSPQDLPNYLEEDEIFTENPNYLQEKNDFCIFDSTGKLILKVLPDETIKGTGQMSFTIPLSHPEDKEAFLDFCDRLQRNSAIKYPKDEE